VTAQESGATKERILDAAERLFSERGFAATSMRAVTSAAGVNLAAVHYHFGSKDALLDEVLGRRLGPLNRERLSALDRVNAAAGERAPEVEAVLRAFLEPAFAFLRDLGEEGSRFVRLAGRAHNDPSDRVRESFLTQFEMLVAPFHGALCRALPGAPPLEIAWKMHFFVGAMAHVLAWTRTTAGAPAMTLDLAETDADRVLDLLVEFCAAGMRSTARAPHGRRA